MMSKLTRGPYPLLGILLLATLLRVWGLTWGLPSATHYYSYHPDESVVLSVASSMNLFAGEMLPHWYHYGSLQIYFVNIANSTAYLFNVVDIVHILPRDLPVWYPQWARMYLIGRCLTVAMGVGTVWATYALGTRLWGRRAGFLSAVILAIMPLHAQQSHWLTVDVPATFWGVLSLVWTAKLTKTAPRLLHSALWAGVFAGLAVATKYSMALVLLPLILACLQTPPLLGTRGGESGASRVKLLATGLAAAVLAFLSACPGALLETHTFLADVRYEAVHVNNADDLTFKDTGNGFVYHVTRNLDAGLGLPLLLLALVSVGYALYRRERGDGLLAAFALPYYIVIGLAAVRYARYIIPLLPIMALWTGRLLADLSRAKAAWRTPALTASVLVIMAAFLDALWLIQPMGDLDNRDWALSWVNRLAPAPATVGFPTQPWFGTAPVSPYFSAPKPRYWRHQTSPELAARIIYADKDWDTALLQAKKPAVVVLSEYDYDDALRVKNPMALAYLVALQHDYTRRFVLSDSRDVFSTYKLISGMPTHDLPHDMLYPYPIISIYQRK